MAEILGWTSSFVLLLTIGHQVYRQWREGGGKKSSLWLFVGQTAASVGFVVYSALIESWVFVVTNSLLLVSAVAGLVITVRGSRKAQTEPQQPSQSLPVFGLAQGTAASVTGSALSPTQRPG